jgi:hypothetical protein
VDNRLVDLSYPLNTDASVQIITSKNAPEALRCIATAPRTCSRLQ